MTAAREHGGGLDAAVARWGRPRADWLDLSTGINAEPYPVPSLAAEIWQRLPDAAMNRRLTAAAAARYGVADVACVVAAPGSQALIQWLPWVMAPSRVAVVGPTYNEHAPAWAAAGHRVIEIAAVDAVTDDVGVLVVVNPNNPDGRRVAPERLRALAEERLVVVDEAFADCRPEFSVAGAVGSPDLDLVVLRSVGKFYGLAGLRLGFALAGRETAALLRAALGPWAVSGPAAVVGATALADDAWTIATRDRLVAAAARLDAWLAACGLRLAGGTELFRLIDDARAGALFEHLARAGILGRRFAEQPTWLRLGLPGAAEKGRLAEALAAFGAGIGAALSMRQG